MYKETSKFKRNTEIETAYWSLYGHNCSSVYYRVITQDRYRTEKVI